MRHIEGFVDTCVLLNSAREEFLYGKNIGKGQGTYQMFYTNDLTPFSSLDEARVAQLELLVRKHQHRGFGDIGIAKIRIDLAETEEECWMFEGHKDLVVVVRHQIGLNNQEYDMYGQFVKSRLVDGHTNGTPLISNGYQPIPDFKLAFFMACDTARQRGWAGLATFQLERVGVSS